MTYKDSEKKALNDPGFCCFITPVWGEEYIKFFLDYCLPSQLSKNNIPGMKRKIKYIIVTSHTDIFSIINSPSYKLLKDSVDEVILIEIYINKVTHDLMSKCYKRGMEKFKINMPFVFLTPDFVIADGTFFNMEAIINSGKRAIYLPGIRLIKEKGMELLRPYFKKENNVLEISSAKLMKIGLKIIHEWGYASFLEKGNAEWLPSNIYWEVGNEGLLAHCFHLHPLMVWPRKKHVSFKGTIDDDLVERSGLNVDDLYVVRDSKDLLICEFSKEDRPCKSSIVKGYMPHLIEWMLRQTQKSHRELFKIPIYIHCGKMTPALWKQVGDKAENYVQDIFKAYAASEINFSLRMANFLRGRYILSNIILLFRGLYCMARNCLVKIIRKIINYR